MASRGFQGLTGAQRELVDYWYRLSAGSRSTRPRRRDVDAGELRAHLANLSIIEVPLAGAARFRLAGSALCDTARTNLQGRRLDGLPQDLAGLWREGLDEALHLGVPVGGLVERPGSEFYHAWLRLPLESDGGPERLILCHDEIVASSGTKKNSSIPALILGGHSSIAA